jgi:protein-disulfide isomerase
LTEEVPRRRPRRIGVIILVAILVIAGFVVASLSLDDGKDEPIEITGASEVQKLIGGIRQLDDRLGSEDAPVTVEVFNDVLCKECAEWQFATIDPLIEERVRDGEVKIIFRHWSVDQDRSSNVGGRGSVAAGLQDHQWQYLELFMRNLDVADDQGVVTETFLEQIANGIVGEFNVEQWQRDFDEDEVTEVLEEDELRGVELRLPADPAVLVSGPGDEELLVDSPSLADVETAIDEAS